MSTLKVDTITDSSSGLTTTINGFTPKTDNMAGRNLIINGAMQVAQRGTSFTPTSINTYSLDRWRSEGYSYDVDVTRQTFTSGQTDVEGFPQYYVTVALNETISAGQYWAFQQRIEKRQVIREGAQTFTLSFWARATSGTVAASSFSYGIGSLGNNPQLTTTWQKITYTFTTTISSSGDYASCYVIFFSPGATATSIDIAQVQLEVGDTATPFEHRSFGEEIELCKRYYQKSSSYGVVPTNGSNATSVDNNTCVPFSNCVQWGGGGIGSYTPIYLPVTMRATPTVTAYGNSSGYLGYLNTGGSSPGSDNTVSYHVNLQLSPYREDRLVINNQATGDTIWGVVGGYECDSEL